MDDDYFLHRLLPFWCQFQGKDKAKWALGQPHDGLGYGRFFANIRQHLILSAMDIEYILNAIWSHQLKITNHADEEAINDALTYDEIYFSTIYGEIIEDYPTDKPYPSCLIFGKNFAGEPIHTVWAYNSKSKWAVLITVYRPDPARWVDWKIRVKK